MQQRADAHEADEPDMLAPSADLVGSQDLFGGAQWRASPAQQANVSIMLIECSFVWPFFGCAWPSGTSFAGINGG